MYQINDFITIYHGSYKWILKWVMGVPLVLSFKNIWPCPSKSSNTYYIFLISTRFLKKWKLESGK